MTCASCGGRVPDYDVAAGVCRHHAATDPEWAVTNRVMCDFVHRRIQPPPVVLDDIHVDALPW